jgi:hypothetical protein
VDIMLALPYGMTGDDHARERLADTGLSAVATGWALTALLFLALALA